MKSSRLKFLYALIVLLVVIGFSIFPKALLRWVPVSTWIIIFLVVFSFFATMWAQATYREGVSYRTFRKPRSRQLHGG
jgi:predicted tellurium resistance membrane protein TerC